MLEERSQVGAVRYRFTHAFFRQTLYEEMIAPQRLKLHQQVARALEAQYAKRLEEHAAELAEHFSQSTDPADLARAVSYSDLAAKRAVSVYAYGEAVRHFEQALKVQKVLDPDDVPRQTDLLLDMGNAMNLSGEPGRALETVYPVAFSLAEAAHDSARASRACTLAMVGMNYRAGYNDFATPAGATWAERADRYAAPDTSARIWADFGLGWRRLMPVAGASDLEGLVKAVEDTHHLFGKAFDLSLRLNDAEAFWFVASSLMLFYNAPQNFQMKQHLVAEMEGRSRVGAPVLALAWSLLLLVAAFLERGQRSRAEEMGQELRQLAERTGQANAILLAMEWQAVLAAMDGRLEEAAAIARQVPTRGDELGIPYYATLVEPQLSRIHMLLGDGEEIRRLSDRNLGAPLKALYAAYLGHRREAETLLQKNVVNRPAFGSVADELGASLDINFLESAVLVGHPPAAEMIMQRLSATRLSMIGMLYQTCVARHFGAAAALLGRYDEARRTLPGGHPGLHRDEGSAGAGPQPPPACRVAAGPLPGREEGRPGASRLRHQGVPGDEDEAEPRTGAEKKEILRA